VATLVNEEVLSQEHGVCQSLVQKHSQDLELCCSSCSEIKYLIRCSVIMISLFNEPVRVQIAVCVRV
jgi:hypothetical protein